MTRRFALGLASGLWLASVAVVEAQTLSAADHLARLDTLPVLRTSSTIGMVSSFDRTGGNDDGFKGTYSFVRKEAGGLVIADLKGPGIVTRIWTPTPSAHIIEFYFDGETVPRLHLPFSSLFDGTAAPFVAPLSGMGAGGFYTYVPLAYKSSLKILVKAETFNFYQINFATYPAATTLDSFVPSQGAGGADPLARAAGLLGSSGRDLSREGARDPARVRTTTFRGVLSAQKPAQVFRSDSGGRIVGIRLSPASAFEGKGRDVVLRVFYDGETTPAIEVPAGDFFGYAWGRPAMASLLVGTRDGTNYAYLPMPFDSSVRVELESQRGEGAIEVQAEISVTDEARQPGEGRLHAVWRRERPTTPGKPFTFLSTRGRGHVVGVVLQAQGTEPGGIPEFFEGDDETIVDGVVVAHGTGSEDFFNGGWYDVPGRWEDRVSLPLSGSLDFKRHLGRTGGYRFLLGDAYPYRQSLTQTIEHGPKGNDRPADYVSLTYFYSEARPETDLTLAPLVDRRVDDPARVVFTPGWTMPIHAFSWNDATLSKHDDRIGSQNLRHLQFRATGREVFGTHYLSLTCEMPQAGRYAVTLEAIAGPTQGHVQMFRNEAPVGAVHDLFAPERARTPPLALGVVELVEGANRVMLKIVGKDPASSGFGLDLYRLSFERTNP